MLAQKQYPYEWGKWNGLRQRKICPAEWSTFALFFACVGSRASMGHTLTRIDETAPWSNDNWVWVEKGASSGLPKDSYEYGVWRSIRYCGQHHAWGSFASFVACVGTRPTSNHMLVRVDETVPWSADNWVWVVKEEVKYRYNTMVEIDGERITIAELSRRHGISHSGLSRRIRGGMDWRDAISSPVAPRKKSRYLFNCEMLSCGQISKLAGIPTHVIYSRMKAGKSLEEAVSKPPHAPKLVSALGETLPISEWASRLGVRYELIDCRLSRGWDPDKAVTTPPMEKEDKGMRGSLHPRSKTNEETVRRVLADRKRGMKATDIAKSHGISVSIVHSVIQKKAWKHVTLVPSLADDSPLTEAWRKCGLPYVRLSGPHAAALMGSEMRVESEPSPALPWACFKVDVPDELLPGVSHVLVEEAPSGVNVHPFGESGIGKAHAFAGLAAMAEESRAEDPEDRMRFLLCRLVLGVACEMTKHRPSTLRAAGERVARQREKSEKREADPWFFRLTRRIKLDCGNDIRKYARGETLPTGRKLTLQHYVRGHWKRQPCGRGGKDRKWQFREPHLRGPKDGAFSLREHVLVMPENETTEKAS